MATYTKPTDIPRWADTSGNVVEPSEAKKDAGWVFEEIPPSSYENWKEKLNGEWWKWIDERFSDGASADELRSLFPLEIQDADFRLELVGSVARVYFDDTNNDWFDFDRTADQYRMYIGNAAEYTFSDDAADWQGNDLENVGTLDASNVAVTDSVITGGLAVGYSGPAVDDEVRVGDANFSLHWASANTTELIFDTSDRITFERNQGDGSLGKWQWIIDGTIEFDFDRLGMRIQDGLYVGSTTGVPTTNDIRAEGDGFFAGGVAAGTTTDPGTGDGIFTRGLVVGFDSAPADNGRIEIGDATFYLDWSSTAATLRMDTSGGNSGIQYDKSNDRMAFQNLGVEEMRLNANGLAVQNGIYVGSATGVPTDNDIYAAQDIIAGNYVASGGNRYTFGSESSTDYFQFGANTIDFYFGGTSRIQMSGNLNGFVETSVVEATEYFNGPKWLFDANDYFLWSDNTLNTYIGGVPTFRLTSAGAMVRQGLCVGFDAAPSAFSRVEIGDANCWVGLSGGDVYFQWEANSYMFYDRSANDLVLYFGGEAAWTFDSASLACNSNSISGVGSLSANNLQFTGTCGLGATNTISFPGNVFTVTLSTSTVATLTNAGLWSTTDGVYTGGLCVGFSGTPVAGRIQIGDADFALSHGTNPSIWFEGSTHRLQFNTANDEFEFITANTIRAKVTGAGLVSAVDGNFKGGLVVGLDDTTPTDDMIVVGDAAFQLHWDGTDPFVVFDTDDGIQYDRNYGNGAYQFFIDTYLQVQIEEGLLDARGQGQGEVYAKGFRLSGGGVPTADAAYTIFSNRAVPKFNWAAGAAENIQTTHSWRTSDLSTNGGSGSTVYRDLGIDIDRAAVNVGDVVHVVVLGKYTPSTATDIELGLSYRDNNAVATYVDLVYDNNVAFITSGFFIIESWICIRTASAGRAWSYFKENGSGSPEMDEVFQVACDWTQDIGTKGFWLKAKVTGESSMPITIIHAYAEII